MSRCELRREPYLVHVVTLNYLIHRVTKISSTAVNTWRLTFDVIVSFQREANWVKSLFKSYIKTVRKPNSQLSQNVFYIYEICK